MFSAHHIAISGTLFETDRKKKQRRDVYLGTINNTTINNDKNNSKSKNK